MTVMMNTVMMITIIVEPPYKISFPPFLPSTVESKEDKAESEAAFL